MTDAPTADPTTPVVMPAGAPLLEAAAWVGASCWLELALHRRLTALLATGIGPDASPVAWTVRAHRAELAEAWHRRLPELREFPRAPFVVAPADGDPRLASLAADPAPTADLASVDAALAALADRYRAHQAVAVGPADGPVAETLRRALARTDADRQALAAVTG